MEPIRRAARPRVKRDLSPLVAQLKIKVQVARRQLGLDEDTYRSLLHTVTRKNSTTEMDSRELLEVLNHMRFRGWTDAPRVRARPQIEKLRSCWLHLADLGAVEARTDEALFVWAQRQAIASMWPAVDGLRFIPPDQCQVLIERLKRWAKRVKAKLGKQP